MEYARCIASKLRLAGLYAAGQADSRGGDVGAEGKGGGGGQEGRMAVGTAESLASHDASHRPLKADCQSTCPTPPSLARHVHTARLLSPLLPTWRLWTGLVQVCLELKA